MITVPENNDNNYVFAIITFEILSAALLIFCLKYLPSIITISWPDSIFLYKLHYHHMYVYMYMCIYIGSYVCVYRKTYEFIDHWTW